ncbi:MAG: hypothetical protein ORN23_06195 [Chthoniobacterales bacterium]|nr:hypothetical protein [Chthoniobacterales bacterium]
MDSGFETTRFRQGVIHPITGKIFWSYDRGREQWITADMFNSRIEKRRSKRAELNAYSRMRYEKKKEELLEKQRIYRVENKERIAQRRKEYGDRTKAEKAEYDRKYRTKNSVHLKKKSNRYYETNRIIISAKTKEKARTLTTEQKAFRKAQKKVWEDKNRQLLNHRRREARHANPQPQRLYYLKNRESILAKNRAYNISNKVSVRAYKSTWSRERRDSDAIYKMIMNTRSLIRNSFVSKRHLKGSKTEVILGMTVKDFVIHIKSMLAGDMKLENHGLIWHLDHKVPVILAITEEEVVLLNHWSNFHPMLGKENIRKSDYLPDGRRARDLSDEEKAIMLRELIG